MKKIFCRLLLVFLLAHSNFISAEVAFLPDNSTVLITGSNRGLGLEFSRQYAAAGWNVIATCRSPQTAKELQILAEQYNQVAIEQMDVTSDSDVEILASKYKNQPIDVLLNNAGIYGTLEKQTLGAFDFEEFKTCL